MKFVKLKLFQVCGLKSLKVNKLTLKLKLMTKKFIDNIKIVDNSYSDEEEKKLISTIKYLYLSKN